MTLTGTTTAPRYIIGGTSSGRSSPFTTTTGFPIVTLTSEPGFATSAVRLAASQLTVAPISSNIERNGTRMTPLRTSAARTRFERSVSGFA